MYVYSILFPVYAGVQHESLFQSVVVFGVQ